jgi:hypothetical protein
VFVAAISTNRERSEVRSLLRSVLTCRLERANARFRSSRSQDLTLIPKNLEGSFRHILNILLT